jgi:hypothetical protein
MAKYTLTPSDKDLILKNHVLPVIDIIDDRIEVVAWFLDNFKYQHGYKRGLYLKRPSDWTKAYIQAIDKVVCFIKYDDVLSNIMV